MKWRKVNRPRSWRPEVGDELIGYYVGKTVRDGVWGQYEAVTVVKPDHGVFVVSGTQIIQLVDVALLKYGSPIRIKFLGKKPVGDDREMKEFELYVSDAELTAEDVLAVRRTVDSVPAMPTDTLEQPHAIRSVDSVATDGTAHCEKCGHAIPPHEGHACTEALP